MIKVIQAMKKSKWQKIQKLIQSFSEVDRVGGCISKKTREERGRERERERQKEGRKEGRK